MYSVTVLPDRETGLPGTHTALHGHLSDSDSDSDRLEKAVRALLAGQLAQRQFDPSFSHALASAELDSQIAMGFIVALSGSSKNKQEACFMRLCVETEALIENHWPQIEAVAEALIEHGRLEGFEIQKILIASNTQR